ncbi:MAG: PKD domain-containing protein [bacterium]
MRRLVVLALLVMLGGCRNSPPEPPLLSGQARLRPGDTLRLSAWSVDPDGDSVGYRVDWGDGNESDWSDWYPSGERAAFAHGYGDTGRFEVTARARDRDAPGAVSDPFFARVYEYGPSRPSRPRLAADTVVVGDSFGCMSSAAHPLNERVALQFDWGDTLGDWSDFVKPDSWLVVRHAYSDPGSYAVRARARDSLGHVSDWSDSTAVVARLP